LVSKLEELKLPPLCSALKDPNSQNGFCTGSECDAQRPAFDHPPLVSNSATGFKSSETAMGVRRLKSGQNLRDKAHNEGYLSGAHLEKDIQDSVTHYRWKSLKNQQTLVYRYQT